MPLTSADLIVEDGTGKPDANSFVDLAFIAAYHRLSDAAAWAAATEHQQVAAAIRATRHVSDKKYIGERKFATQALPWPRVGGFFPLQDADGVVVDGTVPRQLKEATAEYALRALTEELVPDPATSSTYPVQETFEQVGPIVERTVFDTKGPKQVGRAMPAADRILSRSGLLAASGGGRAIRA